MEGQPIRKQIHRYGLGLDIAQDLLKRGVTEADNLREDVIEDMVKKYRNAKRILNKMLRDAKMQKSEEKAEQENYKKQLEEAKKMVEEVSKKNQSLFDKNENLAQQKLKEISNKLQLPKDWNIQKREDPNALLKNIESEISRVSNDLQSKSYESFEDLVTVASGGMITYGMLHPSESDRSQPTRGKFPVLNKPKSVEKLGPELSGHTEFFKSIEENASANFCKHLESSGLSVAANSLANYNFVNAKSSLTRRQQKEIEHGQTSKKNSMHASVVKYKKYPLAAFRIPRDEMVLSDTVKTDAQKVKNFIKAYNFLQDYGSHVLAGVHHLGGVICQIIDIKTEEEMNENSLMAAATEKISTELSIGGQVEAFGAAVSGKVEVSDLKGEVNAEHCKKTNATYTIRTEAFGPDATSLDMFSKILETNNSAWRIIDRGDIGTRIPIWDLLSDLGSEYSEQAHLIKETWKTDEKLSDHDLKQIADLQDFMYCKLKRDWNSESVFILEAICVQIDRTQEELGHRCNVMSKVLKLTKFVEFIKSAIKNKNLRPAQDMIRRMLDSETRVSLIDLALDKDIEDFLLENPEPLESEITLPIPQIFLEDLPDMIFSLSEALEQNKIGKHDCNLKLVDLISNAVVDDKELYDAVLKKAEEFGYQQHYLRFSSDLSADQIKILAGSLSTIVSTNFVEGDTVRFQFDTTMTELGSEKGNKHRIEAVGKIVKVDGFHAYIDWMSLDNRSVGKTIFSRHEISDEQCSKWFGSKKDPLTNTGIKHKMPLSELKRVVKMMQIHSKSDDSPLLKWKEDRKNFEGCKSEDTKINFQDFVSIVHHHQKTSLQKKQLLKH